MPIPKDFKGKKGRSGRKTKDQEIRGAIELITQQALTELARSKVFKQINNFGDNYNVIKSIALPIALKGMVERKDITSGGERIFVDPESKKKADDLLEEYLSGNIH